ncbi:hypothetical protein G7B40_011815 [Aetokthonos hydrillicola Thurmond2011]|jgi:hypothetical protein|uniref:Uncharacterized protein n=1 Tax=Aetokthonos hydrillicola Thurmond2011 TaxID=2712845 RepID=A0AAP5M9Y7_9CYAN|nr:hypothetical protein [Aetokthonos hydrillicola]MBO3459122.1 hypothetical protein [Aetokthonos hydrillicola CCALA 1050]MBW4584704.1 hypothetical protein [Aetokthonos hydrillicola CCALA 1050]MDR9895248.1 hypothetical protein [Aetokthonos hydrillicola Thurmond2011]
MNTHTFDNHYVTCPICQKNTKPKPIKTCIGLFTCPYCQERLVVSQSGHYVRDPFTFRQIIISSTLRRQSRPLARIIRDFALFKRPLLALVIGSVIFLSLFAGTENSTSHDLQQLPTSEKIKE